MDERVFVNGKLKYMLVSIQIKTNVGESLRLVIKVYVTGIASILKKVYVTDNCENFWIAIRVLLTIQQTLSIPIEVYAYDWIYK